MVSTNKKTRIVLWTSIAAAIVLITGFCLSYFVLQVPLFDKTGFRMTDAGVVQYLDYYGRPQQGWIAVEDSQYYFNESGAMQTGWQTLDEKRYYFSRTGVLQTGWAEVNGVLYYLGDDGAMCTGWLDLEGKRYHLAADGVASTGWQNVDGLQRYFDADGALHTGWLELDEGRYYLQPEGTVSTGWQQIDGKSYLFTPDGIATTGWVQEPQRRLYFKEDGAMATGFLEVSGQERYFLPTGEYVPLVNLWNSLTDDYTPQLVEVENYLVDSTCVDALKELMAACRAAGYECHINSAYRDLEKQQSVWEDYRRDYMRAGYSYEQAEKMTARYVAVPGTSEHHLGVAIDFGGSDGIYGWLEKHSWEYGFILRYPEDKTGETGFTYEPWHFRYLGKAMAKDVYDSGLTLEQYFETIKKLGSPA